MFGCLDSFDFGCPELVEGLRTGPSTLLRTGLVICACLGFIFIDKKSIITAYIINIFPLSVKIYLRVSGLACFNLSTPRSISSISLL
jgi:hypothetical protein